MRSTADRRPAGKRSAQSWAPDARRPAGVDRDVGIGLLAFLGTLGLRRRLAHHRVGGLELAHRHLGHRCGAVLGQRQLQRHRLLRGLVDHRERGDLLEQRNALDAQKLAAPVGEAGRVHGAVVGNRARGEAAAQVVGPVLEERLGHGEPLPVEAGAEARQPHAEHPQGEGRALAVCLMRWCSSFGVAPKSVCGSGFGTSRLRLGVGLSGRAAGEGVFLRVRDVSLPAATGGVIMGKNVRAGACEAKVGPFDSAPAACASGAGYTRGERNRMESTETWLTDLQPALFRRRKTQLLDPPPTSKGRPNDKTARLLIGSGRSGRGLGRRR